MKRYEPHFACACASSILAGCAYLSTLGPSLSPLAHTLLPSLDTALSDLEATAAIQNPSLELLAEITVIQATRRILIKQILACLATEHPELDLEPYRDRLRSSIAVPP